MENLHHGFHENEQQSSHPTSPYSNSSSNSSSSSSNGVAAAAAAAAACSPTPLTPQSLPRSIDANPFPTTFIQADASSFKQVVQMLTGSAETAAKHAGATAAPPTKNLVSPAAKATGPKKPTFKLHERRGSLKNLKMVKCDPSSPMGVAFFTPRQPEILSPSMLDLPSLNLSPVTPLIPDPFNRTPKLSPAAATGAAISAEDRAIAQRGFYFHPSPKTTPRGSEPPRLLPLFPVTSPRPSSASAAGTSI
ncbi:VQ motif [Musa troglodytarum]|uniref:VQ motif n=1 Tax=Musa troglodytarum TaxID=320322 RepID=A0A9E7HGW6_9LILI|nr:VQ motif [Musa troglodytarum]